MIYLGHDTGEEPPQGLRYRVLPRRLTDSDSVYWYGDDVSSYPFIQRPKTEPLYVWYFPFY